MLDSKHVFVNDSSTTTASRGLFAGVGTNKPRIWIVCQPQKERHVFLKCAATANALDTHQACGFIIAEEMNEQKKTYPPRHTTEIHIHSIFYTFKNTPPSF